MLRATLKSLLARKLRLLAHRARGRARCRVHRRHVRAHRHVERSVRRPVHRPRRPASTCSVQGVTAFAARRGPGGGGGQEREPVPESVVAAVEAVPGVKQVVGNIQGYAKIVDPVTGDAITPGGAPTIGTSWSTLAGLNLVDGKAPTDGHRGRRRRRHRDGARPLGRPADLDRLHRADPASSRSPASSASATPTACWARRPPRSIAHGAGAHGPLGDLRLPVRRRRRRRVRRELRLAVSQVLPHGYEAITGADAAKEASDQVGEGLGFLRRSCWCSRSCAVRGRVHHLQHLQHHRDAASRELGLLRALGASRRQVMTSVVAEAFVDRPGGVGRRHPGRDRLAIGLQALLRGIGIELPSTATMVLPRTMIVSLGLGTLVTVIASVGPARRASRVAPIEALSETNAPPTSSLRRRSITGGALSHARRRAARPRAVRYHRQPRDPGRPRRGAHVRRRRDAVAVVRAAAGCGDRPPVPCAGRCPGAWTAERHAQPAADRLHVGGADDRSRPGAFVAVFARVAEGLGERHARRTLTSDFIVTRRTSRRSARSWRSTSRPTRRSAPCRRSARGR